MGSDRANQGQTKLEDEMGKLDGKVAIVTGAARGIGKAIALRFAGEGADIVVSDVKTPDVEATAAKIREAGRKAVAVTADVSKKDEVERMVATAVDTFKKVDILVNNAGISRREVLLEMTEEDWDKVLDTNLKGVFLCTQAAAKHMVQQKYGKIINLSSITGQGLLLSRRANYAPSKAGVNVLTQVAARELGPYGINANAIAPGIILTEHTYLGRTPAQVEEFKEIGKKNSALKRLGSPEDVANLALFLASDESSYITGQVIGVDGGLVDFI